MWRLVNEKFSARWEPARDHTLIRRLDRAIDASLKGHRIRRAEESDEEVEMMLGLEPPLYREAWYWMKGWYMAVVDRTKPPDRVTFERITAEQVDLYIYVPPPEENIPVSIDPFPVEESVPTE